MEAEKRLEGVDLKIALVEQVHPWDVSMRIDGLRPEREEDLRRRVIEQLQKRWKFESQSGIRTTKGVSNLGSSSPPIDVSVLVPSLNRSYIADLESDVRAIVVEGLDQRDVQIDEGNGQAQACVCVAVSPGDRIVLEPPFSWRSDGAWVNHPSGRTTWNIGVPLNSGSFDVALLQLSNGASSGVAMNQVMVGLANSTAWGKELCAFNTCIGRTVSVFQGRTNSTPITMLLSRDSCGTGADTVFFRKPGFLGIWHDVGHFCPNQFWNAFGGTIAIFDWVMD